MIRGLYQQMDNQLKELEEKFKKDEYDLREKIDKEIKQQMSDKLKKLKYTNSDIYKEDFLYDFGKNNMYRTLSQQTPSHEQNNLYIHININKDPNRDADNILSYYGFFNNIQLLNNDISLNSDEYVIGIYGDINYTINTGSNIGIVMNSINIMVITNYLNKYKIINQYPVDKEQHRKFNERFQLKLIKKNSIKLFDSQVDDINSSFNKININITEQQSNQKYYTLTTHYYPEIITIIDLSKKHEIYKKTLEKYNINSLPIECLNSNSKKNKYECCQKCYREEEQKKNSEFTKLSNEILGRLQRNETHTQKTQSLTRGSYSIDTIAYTLTDKFHYNNNIFTIFETSFNDFWADKIHEINGDSKADISMAQLIEHKDKTNSVLAIENKVMKQKIKKLEQQVSQNTNCKEYENQLKEQIKQLKISIASLETQLKDLTGDKTELETKYTQLKSKIQTLMN